MCDVARGLLFSGHPIHTTYYMQRSSMLAKNRPTFDNFGLRPACLPSAHALLLESTGIEDRGARGLQPSQRWKKFAKISHNRAEIGLNLGRIFVNNGSFIGQLPQISSHPYAHVREHAYSNNVLVTNRKYIDSLHVIVSLLA